MQKGTYSIKPVNAAIYRDEKLLIPKGAFAQFTDTERDILNSLCAKANLVRVPGNTIDEAMDMAILGAIHRAGMFATPRNVGGIPDFMRISASVETSLGTSTYSSRVDGCGVPLREGLEKTTDAIVRPQAGKLSRMIQEAIPEASDILSITVDVEGFLDIAMR
jgi:hypothetical protein